MQTARTVLCDQCGAPIDVPIEGGSVRCGHCGAHQAVRMRIEAALKRSPTSEPDRLARLAAMDHWAALPPALAELAIGGRILPPRVAQAQATWQNMRTSLRSHAGFELAEHFFLLTLLLAERYLDDRDTTRHRAVAESAIEVLTEPRHRQLLAACLARGACRAGDPDGAEAWMTRCDPFSDDLASDTAYRFARAYLDTAAGRFPAVIHVLGASNADIPLWDAYEAECAMLRANAWERLGQIGFAVDGLIAQKQSLVPAARSRGRQFVALHADWQLCARSEREAEARFMALAPVPREPGKLGIALIGLMGAYSMLAGFAGVGIVALGIVAEADWMAGVMLMAYGFLVGGILVPLWLGSWQRQRRERRTRAQGRQASGQITELRVVPTGGAGGFLDDFNAGVTLWVFPDDEPPYPVQFTFSYVREVAPRIRVGTTMLVRINPADRSDIEIELVG